MKQAITANAVDYILQPFSKEDIQSSVLNAISQIESKTAIQNQLISSEEKKETARYEFDIQMLKNIILGYHTTEHVITSKNLNFINTTHNLILMILHADSALDEPLLTGTNKKMYQIAKSVGYENAKYFFRVFKKKEHKLIISNRIFHKKACSFTMTVLVDNFRFYI